MAAVTICSDFGAQGNVTIMMANFTTLTRPWGAETLGQMWSWDVCVRVFLDEIRIWTGGLTEAMCVGFTQPTQGLSRTKTVSNWECLLPGGLSWDVGLSRFQTQMEKSADLGSWGSSWMGSFTIGPPGSQAFRLELMTRRLSWVSSLLMAGLGTCQSP